MDAPRHHVTSLLTPTRERRSERRRRKRITSMLQQRAGTAAQSARASDERPADRTGLIPANPPPDPTHDPFPAPPVAAACPVTVHFRIKKARESEKTSSVGCTSTSPPTRCRTISSPSSPRPAVTAGVSCSLAPSVRECAQVGVLDRHCLADWRAVEALRQVGADRTSPRMFG